MGFALALAWENKRLLLGESLPASDEAKLRDVVRSHDAVTDLVDLRTVYFGPNAVVVTADIALDDGLDTMSIDEQITEIEEKLIAADSSIDKVYIEPE